MAEIKDIEELETEVMESQNINVIGLLRDKRLKEALREMRNYAANFPEVGAAERLDKIADDYELMLDYMRRGFRDEKREEVYGTLVHRLYKLEMDTALADNIRRNSFYNEAYVQISRKPWEHDMIQYSLESFVSDLAMLSLEPAAVRDEKERELYQRHQDFMSVLFRKIWLAFQWNEGEASFYETLLTSPTIDSRDQQLMVSALTLASVRQFDFYKFRTLVHVYQQSTNMPVRQRALVGWAFSIDENVDFLPEQQYLLDSLCQSPEVCRELLELQMQVAYCLNAEQDTHTIQSDILPTIIKNNNLRITRFGIEEKEDDPMEDILDPGAADRAMEEMEQSVERMMNMQKAGVDIYFGGFSMMKTFPFFRDVANWLMPFYKENPALSRIVDRLQGTRLMENIVENGPFCDSDKYSFAFAVTTVLDRLPPNLREMMGSADALGAPMPPEEMRTPAYVRRMYLQDLYRFFKLFPQRGDMANPFLSSGEFQHRSRCMFFISSQCRHTPLREQVEELGYFLLKHNRIKELQGLCVSFYHDDNGQGYSFKENPNFLLLYAICYEKLSQIEKAFGMYKSVLAFQPDNLRALKGLARMSFMLDKLEQAEECYRRLVELQPDKKRTLLNYGITLLRLNKTEEAMRIIYKLDYEYHQDMGVRRVMTWALMDQGKLEQAREAYIRLQGDEHVIPADYLNGGYCEWFLGNVREAAECFATYKERLDDENYDISLDFEHDADFLHRHGITDIDIALMRDLL